MLTPILRSINRKHLGLNDKLPFSGNDYWHAYELSWLNPKGKPQVAMGRFCFPCQSPNLVESKSFKRYLNGFNQSTFHSASVFQQLLIDDLSQCVGVDIGLALFDLLNANDKQAMAIEQIEGECLDGQDLSFNHYQPEPNLLRTAGDKEVHQTVYSHLLKSNCPLTGLPDWATLLIEYRGPEIDQASLLRYIVSYRQYGDYHEHCVEHIYMDLLQRCKPQALTVLALYLRRGGLDICPFRSNFQTTPKILRTQRQ